MGKKKKRRVWGVDYRISHDMKKRNYHPYDSDKNRTTWKLFEQLRIGWRVSEWVNCRDQPLSLGFSYVIRRTQFILYLEHEVIQWLPLPHSTRRPSKYYKSINVILNMNFDNLFYSLHDIHCTRDFLWYTVAYSIIDGWHTDERHESHVEHSSPSAASINCLLWDEEGPIWCESLSIPARGCRWRRPNWDGKAREGTSLPQE